MNPKHAKWFDGVIQTRSNEIWLWFGTLISLLMMFVLLFMPNWLFSGKDDVLDCAAVISIVSTIALLFAKGYATRIEKASLVLGWMHACVLAYLALFTASVSRTLRFLLLHHPPMFIDRPPAAIIEPLVIAAGRGLALYFIASATVFLIYKRNRAISLPPYGSIFLVWAVLTFLITAIFGAL